MLSGIAPPRQNLHEIGYRDNRVAFIQLYDGNNSSQYTLEGGKYEQTHMGKRGPDTPELVSSSYLELFDDKRELPVAQILGKTRPEVDSLLKRLNKQSSVRQFNLPK